MSINAGEAILDVRPDLSGFGRNLRGQLDSAIDSSAQSARSRLGGALAGIGKVAFVGLAAGLVAGGAGLLKVGADVKAATNTIRIGTGATGEALAGLTESFRAVARGSVDSFGDVSTAIADLNTRTGLTGKPLETLSAQVLALARVTKEDLGETIEAQTRLFGDWGISVEAQASTLDGVFKASQATGIGVNELSRMLVQFGGPLRQLGFGLDESAALLGKFEREGVNSELVLGSLRIALGKFARDGEPARETLNRTVDAIRSAGDASTANALALEVFGARAGPDMAAAIREGRFEIDDLMGAIASSPETIESAARETEELGDKFRRLKNSVMIAVEPLATRFLALLERGVDRLQPFIRVVGERLPLAFAALAGFVAPVVGGIRQSVMSLVSGRFVGDGPFGAGSPFLAGLLGARETVLSVVRSMTTTVTEIVTVVLERARDLWPRVEELIRSGVSAVREIIEGVVEVITDVWDRFGEGAVEVATTVASTVTEVLTVAFDLLADVMPVVVGAVKGVLAVIDSPVFKIVAGIITTLLVPAFIAMGLKALSAAGQAALAWAIQTASAIKGAARSVISLGLVVAQWVVLGVQSLIRAGQVAAAWVIALGPVAWVAAAVAALVALFIIHFDTIRDTVGMAWRWVQDVTSTVWGWIQDHIGTILRVVLGIVTGGLSEVVRFFVSHWDDIQWVVRDALGSVVGFMRDLPGRIFEAIGDLAGRFFGLGAEVMAKLLDGAGRAAIDLYIWLSKLPANLVTAVGDIAGRFFDLGIDLIRGMINGVGSMAKALKDKVLDVVSAPVRGVKNFLGIGSPSRLFAGFGRAIGDGLVVGLSDGERDVAAAFGRLSGVVGSFPANGFDVGVGGFPIVDSSPQSSGARSVTVQIYNPTPEPASRSLAAAARLSESDEGSW